MPTRQTGMPMLPMTSLETQRANPEDSIAALRSLFGLTPMNPKDPDGAAYGDSTGSLALSRARGSRETELENRLANDAFGSRPDPNTGRDALLLKFLKGEQAADPYTGQDATDRTHRLETNVDEAALYDRPDITKMRREDLGNKERLATAPARVAGEYGLRNRALQNEGEIERQRIASQGVVDAARGKAGAGSHILASGLMERVATGAGVLEQLEHLKRLRGTTTTGPVAGPAQTLLQHMPLIPVSKDFATFKAESASVKNAMIKAATGAQMSEPEAIRLGEEIPNENDKDEVWDAKMKVARRKIRGLNVRIDLLNKGVPLEQVNTLSLEALAGADEDDAPDTAAATGGHDDVASIQRGGATGNAFGDLMKRADRVTRPR